MKFAVTILLSALLFFNSSLFTIIYSVKVIELSFISNAKIKLIEENCENENYYADGVSVIKYAANSLNDKNITCLSDDEFIMNGRYCDIISRRYCNDSVYIFFIYDNEEDELNSAATAHYNKEAGKSAEMQYFNILLSFLSNAICNTGYDCTPPVTKSVFSSGNITHFHSDKPNIPTPPPKVNS